jgi:translation initiation factor eIF-2B subunit beta
MPQWHSKHAVIEMLNELIDELDNIETQIASQAPEHIHANEVHGMASSIALLMSRALLLLP